MAKTLGPNGVKDVDDNACGAQPRSQGIAGAVCSTCGNGVQDCEGHFAEIPLYGIPYYFCVDPQLLVDALRCFRVSGNGASERWTVTLMFDHDQVALLASGRTLASESVADAVADILGPGEAPAAPAPAPRSAPAAAAAATPSVGSRMGHRTWVPGEADAYAQAADAAAERRREDAALAAASAPAAAASLSVAGRALLRRVSELSYARASKLVHEDKAPIVLFRAPGADARHPFAAEWLLPGSAGWDGAPAKDVSALLRAAPPEDWAALGIDPEALLAQMPKSLPMLPHVARRLPPAMAAVLEGHGVGGVGARHSQDQLLDPVTKAALQLMKVRDSAGGAPSKKKLVQVQHAVSRMRAAIAERLPGKDGRLRGDLQAKRCNQTARAVIIGDPFIDIDEVGVPEAVARDLCVDERVFGANIQDVKRLVGAHDRRVDEAERARARGRDERAAPR